MKEVIKEQRLLNAMDKLLFARKGAIIRSVRDWNVMGAFDEKSGESAHALGCLNGTTRIK